MPKLDLSKTAVLSPEEREQFKSAQQILDDVKADAEKLGLVKYPKPSTAPESLADIDIAEMPNNQLGQLYTRYTAHAQWVFGELAQAEIAYKLGVASLKLVDAKLKSKLFSQEVAKAEVPARVREDPTRVEYEIEVLKLFAMKEILGAHYKAYSKQAEALSRIIALRELDFDMQTREMGIQGRRKGPAHRPHDFRRG
jgi:hypothetical protein